MSAVTRAADCSPETGCLHAIQQALFEFLSFDLRSVTKRLQQCSMS
jgi:hypothetical protein